MKIHNKPINNVQFSIVIITRNRVNILKKTLESVKKIDYSIDDFEIIIVDNGSTDNTRKSTHDVLENSNLQYQIVSEKTKGICKARNRGLQVANGEWVLFFDDDVFVNKNILTVYQNAQLKFPNAVAFGGPANLDPVIPRPWWWISEFDKTMSCQNYGDNYMEYGNGTNPYGLNMLFSKDILFQFNGFDEKLDKLTNSFADETELFFRIKQGGYSIVYVPAALVIHSIVPDRLEWRNFITRFLLVGRSHACLDYMHNTNHSRSLFRRMVSASYLFIKHPTPALFFTEYYSWIGYRNFKYEKNK